MSEQSHPSGVPQDVASKYDEELVNPPPQTESTPVSAAPEIVASFNTTDPTDCAATPRANSEPPFTVTAVEPDKAPLTPNAKTPPFTVVAPVYVLAPFSVSVPAFAFSNEPVPSKTPA